MSSQLVPIKASDSQASMMEKVLLSGDLSKLTPNERLSYYNAVCESIGLNPLTRPFDYVTLNGKLQLYPRRECKEQLRKIHNISVTILAREVVEGCYVVTARATMPNGRSDESIGAVPIENLKGEARSNAMMKCETKAKSRVTLSIAGLAFTDETEIDSIPGAKRQIVDEAGVIVGQEGGTREAAKEVAAAKLAGEPPPAMAMDVPSDEDIAKAEADAQEKKELLRAIMELVTESLPGKSAEDQAAKKRLLAENFGYPGWTAVQNLSNDTLRAGLTSLRSSLDSTKEVRVTWRDKFDMLDDFARIKADLISLSGPAGEAEYYRVLKSHGVEKSNQFKDTPTAMRAYNALKQVRELMQSMKTPEAEIASTGA